MTRRDGGAAGGGGQAARRRGGRRAGGDLRSVVACEGERRAELQRPPHLRKRTRIAHARVIHMIARRTARPRQSAPCMRVSAPWAAWPHRWRPAAVAPHTSVEGQQQARALPAAHVPCFQAACRLEPLGAMDALRAGSRSRHRCACLLGRLVALVLVLVLVLGRVPATRRVWAQQGRLVVQPAHVRHVDGRVALRGGLPPRARRADRVLSEPGPGRRHSMGQHVCALHASPPPLFEVWPGLDAATPQLRCHWRCRRSDTVARAPRAVRAAARGATPLSLVGAGGRGRMWLAPAVDGRGLGL